jgi:hypothetical protein
MTGRAPPTTTARQTAERLPQPRGARVRGRARACRAQAGEGVDERGRADEHIYQAIYTYGAHPSSSSPLRTMKSAIPCQLYTARGIASDGDDALSAVLAPALCDLHKTDTRIQAIFVMRNDHSINDMLGAAAGERGKTSEVTGARLRFCSQHERCSFLISIRWQARLQARLHIPADARTRNIQ